MERLPQELVDDIAKCLPPWHKGQRIRPGLATLSRPWQYAIEQLTFKSIRITNYVLEDFCKFFASNTTRRRFLKRLSLHVILPSYSDDDCAHYETADDRAATNRIFNRSVAALLQQLSQWPADGKLSLDIDMYSFMDVDHRNHDELQVQEQQVDRGTRIDLFAKRYSHSYTRLTEPLAVVPRITSFYANFDFRNLDPGSLIAMTAVFPNLESIKWPFKDPAYFLALRRQHMQDLASAVASFQPPALCKTLTIHFYSRWYPHKERLPNLNQGNSSFCGSLCALLERSNIQRLKYWGHIDPTLFWPRQTPETDKTPSWRSLQELNVKFDLGSFAGQWFFKGLPGDVLYEESSDIPLSQDTAGLLPPGYYDSDERNREAVEHAESMEIPFDEESLTFMPCEFRCIPRDEAMLPLLTAVAHRLAHTPSLQKFSLYSVLGLDMGIWFFEYKAPGQMSEWDKYLDCEESRCRDPVSRARVFLHAGDWRPDSRVLALLRGIGRAWNGKDAIVTFLPFLF